MLTRITQVDPDFSGAHTYLERLYLVARKDKEFLSEAMISARLKQDADKLERINAASSAFAKGGRTAMFASLIAAAERDFRQNEGSALYLAQLYAAQGDRDSTLLWLKRAEAVRQPDIRRLVSYPDFVSYRNDPAFAAYFPPR